MLGLPGDTPLVTRDQVRHAKPDPDLFLAAAARIGVDVGNAIVVGRKSSNSLYDPEVVSFDTFENYNSDDAGGFIRMNALRFTLNRSLKWDL